MKKTVMKKTEYKGEVFINLVVSEFVEIHLSTKEEDNNQIEMLIEWLVVLNYAYRLKNFCNSIITQTLIYFLQKIPLQIKTILEIRYEIFLKSTSVGCAPPPENV